MKAPSDQHVDLGGLDQWSSFSGDAGFDWQGWLGGVCHHRVPALSDPLEGAEDAGEHQGVGLLPRHQGQGVFDQELGHVVLQAGVETPALLVVQAAGQHVLHQNVEVLLV